MSASAAHVIRKCGGPQAVAEMLSIDLASVYKWRYPRSKGGTNGLIPASRQSELMKIARAKGIDLTPEDFFPVEATAPSDVPRPEPTPVPAATEAV